MKRNRYTVAVTGIGINHPTQYRVEGCNGPVGPTSIITFLLSAYVPITYHRNSKPAQDVYKQQLIQLRRLKKAHLCNETNGNDRVDDVKMTKDSEQKAMAKLTPPDATRSFNVLKQYLSLI